MFEQEEAEIVADRESRSSQLVARIRGRFMVLKAGPLVGSNSSGLPRNFDKSIAQWWGGAPPA